MTTPELVQYYERRYGPFVHMAPLDKAIFVRWLMSGATQFAPFTYDLRVGEGTPMPAGTDAIALRVRDALSTKRIDALCWLNGAVIIIEVKQRAGLSAIGQLIGYRDLYRRQFPQSGLTEMWLVTDQLQPDMAHLLTENNIRYFEEGL